MSAKENKDILRRAAEAFNDKKERTGWFEIHDPGVLAYGLGPEPLNLEGLKKFYSALWTGFPDLRIAIEDLVAEGEKVAWRVQVTGTHSGPFQGVPATGTAVKFEAQYVFEFRNGKIMRRWSSLDRLSLLMQLGAIHLPV